jgi:hypothetical protein
MSIALKKKWIGISFGLDLPNVDRNLFQRHDHEDRADRAEVTPLRVASLYIRVLSGLVEGRIAGLRTAPPGYFQFIKFDGIVAPINQVPSAHVQEDSMGHLSIFNIGTGHDRRETSNLLIKLFHDSPARAILEESINDQNHKFGDVDYKVINDGIGTSGVGKKFVQLTGFGTSGFGIKRISDRMFDLVTRVKPSEVTIVGHSRGAVIAVRIAALLFNKWS